MIPSQGTQRGQEEQREARSVGRWEHKTPQGWRGSMLYPGQAVRTVPGCWTMSQAGGQATAISRPCSSLTLEHCAGSKPQRPTSPVSQSR